MKTNILKSIVLVLILSVANSNVNAAKKFYSNEELKGEMVVAKTIYSYDGQLHNHLKYNYTYDENARMTSKETLKWDKENNAWMPYYKLEFLYTDNQMIVELKSWNSKQNSFSDSKQRSVYELNSTNQFINHLSYNWDNKTKEWKVANEVFLNNNELLAAKK